MTMNTTMKVLARNNCRLRSVSIISAAFLTLAVMAADHDDARREGDRHGGSSAAHWGQTRPYTPVQRGGYVDRSIHGSVRHAETHVVPRHFESERHFERGGNFRSGWDVFFHREFS